MEATLDAVVDYDNDNLDNIAVDYAGDKNMNLNKDFSIQSLFFSELLWLL